MSNENKILNAIMQVLLAIVAFTLIRSLFKDRGDVISDEGYEVLENEEQMERVHKKLKEFRENPSHSGSNEVVINLD